MRQFFILLGIFVLVTTLLNLVPISVKAQMVNTEHIIGFGFGLPYSLLGVNYEYGAFDYFAPTVGLGVLPDNIGWNIGARLYYPGRNADFRGRATVLYGTNTVIEKKGFGETEYEADEGVSAGLGINWRFGESWAFDFDLFYADVDVPIGYEEYGPDIKVSIGFSKRL